jgi:hypothetical protein
MSHDDHRELLERHAPVLRLDSRELFSPTSVDGYVALSELWDRHGLVVQSPSLDDLDQRWSPDTNLRFVGEGDRGGLAGLRVGRAARRLLTPRLGRVGLFGRIIDALFMLSVWFRPTTPTYTTAAAVALADRHDLQDPDRAVCYARALRAGEWLVLHYCYFYVMNDWRSGYRGLNDHEGDWEQAWVFCDPETMRPEWIAASSHENSGADLRRHWLDPELEKLGEQPVLYASAGSHALFYQPGEYVSRVDIPAFRWLLRMQHLVGRLFGRQPVERGLGPALGVPFIDSAVGDGRQIDSWDLKVVGAEHLWIEEFRGLWGRDTGDPTNAERGPSGPKFDRLGEVRDSWADPLGFAGMHGTPPPSARAARVNLDKIDRAMSDLDLRIRQRGRLLPLAHQTASRARMGDESRRLTELLRQQCELETLRRRVENGQERAFGIRDHLEAPAAPVALSGPGAWAMATWAAASVPLLLAGAATMLMRPLPMLMALAVVVGPAVMVELTLRRRFQAAFGLVVLHAVTLGASAFMVGAVMAAGRYVLGALLVAASAVLLVTNGIELWRIRLYRTQSASDRSVDPPDTGSDSALPAALVKG